MTVEVDGEVLAAYDITIYADAEAQAAGIEWQPADDTLTVHFYDPSLKDVEAVDVYHMADETAEPELVATVTPDEDGAIEFEAESFSVYIFTQTILSKTVTTGDGATYAVEVTYPNTAEIPMRGTALQVSELHEGDAGYEGYVAAAAEKLGAEAESLTLSRVFDIKIVDEADSSRVYEPVGDVSVSIRLLGETLEDYADVDVLHFVENSDADGAAVQAMDSAVAGETLQFTTSSFSVYVVIGHENGTVENPRVLFHFIADGATEQTSGGDTYLQSTPYEFKNKGVDDSTVPATSYTQTTQILKNGESLELITDPGNKVVTVNGHDEYKFFYGWYVVNPYGDGIDNNYINYTWPTEPQNVTFESPITIEESNVAIGSTVHWSINGVSFSGPVDADGNVHVFLAPLFENYNFANFMLYPADSRYQAFLGSGNDLMTRKMIAKGLSNETKVKISDIRSSSTDPVHIIFTGWEYDANAGTGLAADWQKYRTVDVNGGELCDPGEDGVYITVDLTDTTSIDLYPIYVEARWVNFVSGITGSGASYVSSQYLEAWGDATPAGTVEERDKNIFVADAQHSALDTSTRPGYDFEGWYAFAVLDQTTGEITNLNTPADVTVRYVDVNNKFAASTVTVNTTAIKITDANGNICYSGGDCGLKTTGVDTYSIVTDGTCDADKKLFGPGTTPDSLLFYDPLDSLKLTANWTPSLTQITVVYWTENAQDVGYTAPSNIKDDYTASKVKVITTDELTQHLSGTYSSGSTITRTELEGYLDQSVSILATAYLDDIGAVTAGEEKFYELNTTLSDSSKVIEGDGRTVFNVYYDRMTFKLVFHIGRDGYVKQNGQQKTDSGWDGNWIEFMYNDATALTYKVAGGNHNGSSYAANFTLTDTVTGRVYTSNYDTATDHSRGRGDYVPGDGEDVYVITAKYGAYIGDRWPTPVNTRFTFSNDPTRSMYIWAAYYGSLYCGIAHSRTIGGNPMGNNPDINGVYNYMSAELCANRNGTDIINANRVHHLVAYYGDTGKAGVYKNYHALFEAIDGTYDPSVYTTIQSGASYMSYSQTTWSVQAGDPSAVDGHDFYEKETYQVISNLEPEYQLGTEIDGYDLVFSCYNTPNANNHHIYFFYRPKQYTLTFVYEQNGSTHTDAYPFYYTQPLTITPPVPEKEGYAFKGWYTNEEGKGSEFVFDGSHTMPSNNVVLYPRLDVLQYTVQIDPNGGIIDHINYDVVDYYGNTANQFGVTGTGYDTDKSTYFTGNYGTQVGEYTIQRPYVALTSKEKDPTDNVYYDPSVSGQEWYYYVNTQFNENLDGDWGLPPNLRNAVYMTEAQLRNYYNFYADVATDNLGYYTGVTVLNSFDAFAAAYTSYPGTPYRPVSGSEHYTFMGWYQVNNDGSLSYMPYNFNDPITGPLKLRALWRLDGGYYVKYNAAYYYVENGTVTKIIGQMSDWLDPTDPGAQLYADQSPTHILRAPTYITAPGDEKWVFRGWRVVRQTGTGSYTDNEGTHSYPIWEAYQLNGNGDPVYYQPGDNFTIDSDLVSEYDSHGGIIHMQAFYEKEDDSHRRPYITDLILDANDDYGGYVNTSDSTQLPDLSGPGSSAINTATELDTNSNPTQILFGDFQSNIALHLRKYSLTPSSPSDTVSHNFFTNSAGYLLIGFDENSDPNNPTTGSAYVPAFAADSVIAVQRNEDRTLYAMWEPMVYVTFVNTTAEPITVTLSGSGNAIYVINLVTGTFDREASTNTITVPASSGGVDGEVKIVLPRAAAGTDTITATATNDHLRKKMWVAGEFNGAGYGNAAPTGDHAYQSQKVNYNDTLTYTGTLQTDATGVVVTYREEPVREILYDVNGGVWTGTAPYSPYEERETGRLFALDEYNVGTPGSYTYEPADPTYSGKVFLGWTTNEDIAAHTDFSSTTSVTWGSTTINPDTDGIVLDKISDYLWDFDADPTPLYGDTLYAVWSDTVTVIFDLIRGTSDRNHTWNQTGTTYVSGEYDAEAAIPGTNAFYRWGNGSSRYVTYTVKRGERIPRPTDPTHYSRSDWVFLEWLTAVSTYTDKTTGRTTVDDFVFDFDQRVQHTQHLYTSWTEASNFQVYTFTVQNVVENPINANDEFEYTITAEDVGLQYGSNSSTNNGPPTVPLGTLTTYLKNNETYTLRITITKEPNQSNTTHAYVGYDVFAEVIDRDGATVGSEHLLNYQGENDVARQYKYTIRVAQEDKAGYTVNVTTDPTGTEILELDYDQFTFTSKTGTTGTYIPNVNAFNGGTANDKNATITFTNRRAVDLTLTKDLAVMRGDHDFDFTFTLTSVGHETAGTSYPYTKTRSAVQTGSGWLETGDTFTLKDDESITIALPPNEAVVITETNGYYTPAWTTNDATVSLSNANTAAATFTLSGDGAALVTNSRGTHTVTVEKIVSATNTGGTFGFTVTLLEGTTPFVGYETATGYTTDASGQISFTLSHNGTRTLTIPDGAKLVVEEAVQTSFTPSAEMVDGNSVQVPDDDTAQGSFTLNHVTTDGTITFTNTEVQIDRVLYDVNGGIWTDPGTDPNGYYQHFSGDVYGIDAVDIPANGGYEPTDPTRSGKIFIGWTTNAALAAVTDFSGTSAQTFGGMTLTPGTGEILLDRVRSEALWDFSADPALLYNNDLTLYAVWSDAVTVTFDLVRSDNTHLHTWEGPATTTTQGPYVFYRNPSTASTITYTLAKGEAVPKPSDPTTDQTGWYFVSWLRNNNSRRNTTKNPSDPTIVSNTYDFTQRVMDSTITLSTSWTATQPQIFTFTVENRVSGDPNEEFTYTIAVSGEKVFGKIGTNTSNTFGNPDQHWGSVTTTLKNNETYTIQIKVLNSTKWTPNTYSIEIDVTDRDGNLVKSGHVVYCNNNSVNSEYSGKNYTSDYKYVLTVVQDEKLGYETTVGVEDRNNVDLPPAGYDETSDPLRKYTFYSSHWGTPAQESNFTPKVNDYTGNESNSMTIVFTNTGTAIVAPTDLHMVYLPFLWAALFGVAFCGIIVLQRRRQRKRADEA